MKPLCIDLFCGLGGWTDGFLAEGYDCIGFDIERHEYCVPESFPEGDGAKGTKPVAKRGWTQGCAVSLGMEGTRSLPRTRLVKYPAQLVLQDVLTLDGAQFRNAACIVASPPCQCYSYMAMPWTRAKKIAAEIRESPERIAELNALFDACFRIQREAIESSHCPACGGNGCWPSRKHIPLSTCWQCNGSGKRHIPMVVENVKGAQPWVGRAAWHYGSFYLWGDVPALMPFALGCKPDVLPPLNGHDDPRRGRKNTGGSWFGVGSPGQKELSQNPVTGEGIKQHGSGAAWFDKALDERRRQATATKNGNDWFGSGENCSLQRRASSRSSARKAASAQIARIPEALARHIARCYKP